jgi:hypothetical protein
MASPSVLPRLPFHSLCRIGVDLFEARAFKPALDVFRLLVARHSHDPTVWYWLGRCHQELDEPEVARRLFEVAGYTGRSPLFRALARGAGQPRPRRC